MTTATTSIHSRTAADDAVVLRPANLTDGHALRRLAELDSAAPLRGPVLIAERDSVPAAALELNTGRTIADPFQATAGLVGLLETRAELLRHAAIGRSRRGALTLLRRARSAA